MASTGKSNLEDSRRPATGSPKLRARGELVVVSGPWCFLAFKADFANSLMFFLENAKDTLCRNVTIYGRCRYEDKGTANRFLFPLHIIDYELDLTAHPKGCAFNHDPQKMNPANNSDRLGYSYSWKTQHLCV